MVETKTESLSGEIRPQAPQAKREGVLGQFKRHNKIMSAFLVRPQNVRVEIQEDDEEILLLTREHVITNLPWVTSAIFLALLPLAYTAMPLWGFLPGRFQAVGLLMWYLLVLTVIVEGFLSWYFDVFVVTNKRIIDIDFKNLIYKNISSATIEHIQDVTYNVGGPIASLLDYGLVMVQTASEIPMLEIPNTPHPAKVAQLVDELMMKVDQENKGRGHE
jgi:hypothetical protein